MRVVCSWEMFWVEGQEVEQVSRGTRLFVVDFLIRFAMADPLV